MSKASNYLEDATINYFLRGQTVARPTQLFIALYKINPTDGDTGAEVVGGGYTRQPINFGQPTQQSDRAVSTNTERIEFPTSTNGWGEVAYFGIKDAKDGGNLIVYGAFNRPIEITEGNKFIIEVGNLSVSVG
ncbi:phage tail fiber protein [Peptoniphilus senegalensis]|uniref:phage tail fiber protein n=1 Tax=Peptoniphilus senegalensis TaxID=1465757 RepID=UPI0002EB0CED|nr:hypothetical protein [Peptoniphilus senegalensis]